MPMLYLYVVEIEKFRRLTEYTDTSPFDWLRNRDVLLVGSCQNTCISRSKRSKRSVPITVDI